MSEKTVKQIEIPDDVSVRTLADLLKVSPTDVISRLMKNGVLAHINQSLDFDTAALLAEEYGYEAIQKNKISAIKNVTVSGKGESRAPIVTILGHVDHGKTSLLDYLRQSSVAKSEAGGITQHISAYQIEYQTKDRKIRQITFVDTPGHEAFSALRAHGASLNDLAVLVVAADDGVKPQTVEAINQAKKANVPIIVAVTKIDAPGANIEKVKQQLTEYDLVAEEWGGKTVVVGVSSKTGEGMNDLLEMIVLSADLLQLKADPDAPVEGIVLEGTMDAKTGVSVVVLLYNGTLRVGQVVATEKTYGRIKAMYNDKNESIHSAKSGLPIKIVGLKEVPSFGDRIITVPNEKIAKSITQSKNGTSSTREQKGPVLPVIIKADVGGSLAALQEMMEKTIYRDAHIEVVSSSIGAVNENDLKLAKAANADIISFRVPSSKRIQELAEKDGVKIKESWVIYEINDYVTDKLKTIASKIIEIEKLGKLKILEVFRQKKGEGIIGGEVVEGKIIVPSDMTIYREKEEIGTAQALQLQMGKIVVDEVTKGQQCGVLYESSTIAISKGDLVEFTKTLEK